MRAIFILCGLVLVVGTFFVWRSLQGPAEFGTPYGAPTVEVADLIEHPKDFLGKTVAVEGTVTSQCKTMGCYFFLPSGKKMLRVDLQEIAMHAPRKEGHRVRVEGQIVAYGDGYQLLASAVEFE